MNWYKKSQFNMTMPPEVTQLASSISSILIKADKGYIVNDADIHSIVSTIPSVPVLEQATESALKLAAVVSGISDMTPQRENVIKRINDTFTSTGNQNIEVNNDLAQENFDADSQAPQVQQEI